MIRKIVKIMNMIYKLCTFLKEESPLSMKSPAIPETDKRPDLLILKLT